MILLSVCESVTHVTLSLISLKLWGLKSAFSSANVYNTEGWSADCSRGEEEAMYTTLKALALIVVLPRLLAP